MTHAPSMAAEGHQTGDYGSLAGPSPGHQHGSAALSRGPAPKGLFQLLEDPAATHEDRVRGDAGHLEEQRLQHDVRRLVGQEPS